MGSGWDAAAGVGAAVPWTGAGFGVADAGFGAAGSGMAELASRTGCRGSHF